MPIQSGTGVSLRYAREAVRGTTPAAVATQVTDIAAAVGGTGDGQFTRATGSFVDDGFAVGQLVRTTGFTTSANNGDWRVTAVAALTLTVEDTDDDIALEASDVSQGIVILMNAMRSTGRNINLTKGALESAEVRADRQLADMRHGFNQVAGSPGFELSLESYDDMLEFAFARAWKEVLVTGGPNFGVHTSGYFERSAGSFIDDGFRIGDIIRTASFSNSVNNGDWRVTAVTATQLTVYTGSSTLITEATGAGPTLVYPGKRLDIGSVLSTFTMERAFADVTKYQVFKGVCVDQMSLSVQPEAIVGGTLTLLGMSADAMASSPLTTAVTAAGTNSPFAAFNGNIFEGGGLIAVCTSLDFALANNRALAPVIGSKFSPDVFEGTARITGNLTAFFEDETLYNKFVNETESSIWFKLEEPDAATNFMSVVFPRVKYTGDEMDPPQEGPVPQAMPFAALVKTGLADVGSATLASSLTIQRSNTSAT